MVAHGSTQHLEAHPKSSRECEFLITASLEPDDHARDTGSVEVIVRAEVGAFPLWTPSGVNIVPNSLPLSSRVLVALEDWTDFFDDVGGAMSDPEIVEEFVGQGFKIAHAIRRELKGSCVWIQHPVTDERFEIELRRSR